MLRRIEVSIKEPADWGDGGRFAKELPAVVFGEVADLAAKHNVTLLRIQVVANPPKRKSN